MEGHQGTSPEHRGTLVIIPAYNEQASIGDLLDRLAACGPLRGLCDVLVVDDGSSDATLAEARRRGVAVAPLPIHLGIGAALRAGFRHAADAGYERAVQLDADGQHDPAEITRILAGLDDGADLVIGSRFVEPGDSDSGRYLPSRSRRVAMRWLRLGVRAHTGARHTDPSSGFRGFSRRMIQAFADDYPLDYLESVEALITAHHLGYRVAEVPITGRVRVAGVPSHRGHRLGFHYLRMWLSLSLKRRRRPVNNHGTAA
ncbi:MAG: glycosyltransferase family 2 protein [Microthrixaceae bacterium]